MPSKKKNEFDWCGGLGDWQSSEQVIRSSYSVLLFFSSSASLFVSSFIAKEFCSFKFSCRFCASHSFGISRDVIRWFFLGIRYDVYKRNTQKFGRLGFLTNFQAISSSFSDIFYVR